ncbi:hypothetical protein [Aerosakkonema funiforme]|uniref:hypothetical protein n=1 Tax=Aerosakkonema funiforme TaxID=1246630 RepID=UPI0035B92B2E
MTEFGLKATVNIDSGGMEVNQIEIRSRLSFSHLKASAHLARLSYEIEAADDGKHSTESFYVHRAYVIGSIITATSYLEASINECLAALKEGDSSIKLSADAAALMKIMWEDIDLKKKILEKYQILLTLTENEFDTGKEPYESTSYLIKLRNALVHYKPEWVGTGDVYEKTFSEKLRKNLENKIKKLNPLAGAGDCAFFPHKCLGYGCAKWAVETSIKFTDEFFSKMGLPSNLNENVRSEMSLPEIPLQH